MLPLMSSMIHSLRSTGNPVIAARRAAWANLWSEAASRPLPSVLIGALCLGCITLGLFVLDALVAQHAITLLEWLTYRAGGVWSAMFLLCLAILLTPARRDLIESESGWLSALPQMPQAMHQWSRWRSFVFAVFQALVLLAGVMSIHRNAPGEGELGVADWLPALVIPVLAWLTLPVLVRPRNQGAVSGSPRPRVRARAPEREPRSMLAHWQWTDYKSRRWTAGTRWSLGLVVLLVPAGATFVQVGVTLLFGVLLVQWFQLWSSCLRVVVQASALTGALPQRAWPFIGALCRLPLLAAVILPLFAFAVLAGLGLPALAALAVALAIFGALTLHAASVLAWRNQPCLLELRSVAVLLTWLVFSQAVPFMAPLIWLGLLVWLLRRAGRGAP